MSRRVGCCTPVHSRDTDETCSPTACPPPPRTLCARISCPAPGASAAPPDPEPCNPQPPPHPHPTLHTGGISSSFHLSTRHKSKDSHCFLSKGSKSHVGEEPTLTGVQSPGSASICWAQQGAAGTRGQGWLDSNSGTSRVGGLHCPHTVSHGLRQRRPTWVRRTRGLRRETMSGKELTLHVLPDLTESPQCSLLESIMIPALRKKSSREGK